MGGEERAIHCGLREVVGMGQGVGEEMPVWEQIVESKGITVEAREMPWGTDFGS